MKRWALVVVLIAALVGAVVASVSTSQHLRIFREGFETKSFCAINETINCDIVNASSYSEVFGVPVAWWGLAFYVIAGGFALFSIFSKKDRRPTVAILIFMSLAAMAYTAYLAYVAIAILGVVCIECLGMHAANIAITLFAILALGIPIGGWAIFVRDYIKSVFGRQTNLSFSPQILTHAIAIALVFLAAFFSIKAIQAGDKKFEDAVSLDEKVKAFYMQSLYAIEPDSDWTVWGNPKAKVTIVEFSDYQCPFCRVSALNVRPYLNEFRDDIRFYFVNYPLDNSCNPEMQNPMHQFACLAAKAALCAGSKNKFWEFHDELFKDQKKINRENILKMGENYGFTPEEFEACIDSPEIDARLKKDIEGAKKSYISGTPTLFIDNRKIRYWRDPKFLQAIVKEEIKKAK